MKLMNRWMRAAGALALLFAAGAAEAALVTELEPNNDIDLASGPFTPGEDQIAGGISTSEGFLSEDYFVFDVEFGETYTFMLNLQSCEVTAGDGVDLIMSITDGEDQIAATDQGLSCEGEVLTYTAEDNATLYLRIRMYDFPGADSTATYLISTYVGGTPTATPTASPSPSPTQNATPTSTPSPSPTPDYDGRALGDYDCDHCTGLTDFLLLLDYWENVSPLGGDPIGLGDFLILLDNWGTGTGC